MSRDDALGRARRAFAEELRALSGLRSEALVRAFAMVPRERFLGPGPWRVVEVGQGYRTTPDDDPRHLYRCVLVALDEARGLNNGEPASLAGWIDSLDLRPGDRVLHVGCGVGYYTAVIAETVGAAGRVVGVEADPGLAARAAAALADRPGVEVSCGDGVEWLARPKGAFDAIFVNAGATRLEPAWLGGLAPGGRLLLPLTVSPGPSGMGGGHMLRVERGDDGFAARFVSTVGIYPLLGGRDPEENERLSRAYARGGESRVRALRLDPHEPAAGCWLHAGVCLSTV